MAPLPFQLIFGRYNNVELTEFVQTVDYVPRLLGRIPGLFRTRNIVGQFYSIGKEGTRLALIPTSPRGAPPEELEQKGRDIRAFQTGRLAKGSTLYYDQFTGLISMPDLDRLETIDAELARRGAALREDVELTNEHHRFGTVMGVVLDADGVTVLEDWYANWGITPTPASSMALNVATTNVRAKCYQVREKMKLSSPGGWVEGVTRVHALCGPTFFELLITHPNVEKLWLNQSAALELRNEVDDEEFTFGGIVFHNYRGTIAASDIGERFKIDDDECQFFPVGANQMFERILGSAEFMPYINQPGQELYSIAFNDTKRNAWERMEVYQYPAWAVLRPQMLFKGTVA
jgi:hypothetical protein